jgi:hypothetical protein
MGGEAGSCMSVLGMGLCPMKMHGAASCVHEGASRWRELFGAQGKGEECNPVQVPLGCIGFP